MRRTEPARTTRVGSVCSGRSAADERKSELPTGADKIAAAAAANAFRSRRNSLDMSLPAKAAAAALKRADSRKSVSQQPEQHEVEPQLDHSLSYTARRDSRRLSADRSGIPKPSSLRRSDSTASLNSQSSQKFKHTLRPSLRDQKKPNVADMAGLSAIRQTANYQRHSLALPLTPTPSKSHHANVLYVQRPLGNMRSINGSVYSFQSDLEPVREEPHHISTPGSTRSPLTAPLRSVLKNDPPSVISDVTSEVSAGENGGTSLNSRKNQHVSFTDVPQAHSHATTTAEEPVVNPVDIIDEKDQAQTSAVDENNPSIIPTSVNYNDALDGTNYPDVSAKTNNTNKIKINRKSVALKPDEANTATDGKFAENGFSRETPLLAEAASSATVQETSDFGYADIFLQPKDLAEKIRKNVHARKISSNVSTQPAAKSDTQPIIQKQTIPTTEAKIVRTVPSSLKQEPSSDSLDPLPEAVLLARALHKKLTEAGLAYGSTAKGYLSDSDSESSFKRRNKGRKKQIKDETLGLGSFSTRKRAESISSLQPQRLPSHRSRDTRPLLSLRHTQSMSFDDPKSANTAIEPVRKSSVRKKQSIFRMQGEPSARHLSPVRFREPFRSRILDSSDEEDYGTDSKKKDYTTGKSQRRRSKSKSFFSSFTSPLSPRQPYKESTGIFRNPRKDKTVHIEADTAFNATPRLSQATLAPTTTRSRKVKAARPVSIYSQRTGKPKKFVWLRQFFGITD